MSTDNLYQRNGVYWIRYNVNGRKVRRSLKTESLREATRLKNEILGTRDAGCDVRAKFGLAAAPADAGAPALTFDEVADRFIRHKQISRVTEHTAKQGAGMINGWLRPAFGPRPVNAISRDDVIAFLGTLKTARGRKGGRPLDDNYQAEIFKAAPGAGMGDSQRAPARSQPVRPRPRGQAPDRQPRAHRADPR